VDAVQVFLDASTAGGRENQKKDGLIYEARPPFLREYLDFAGMKAMQS